jgi:hypothetical protein
MNFGLLLSHLPHIEDARVHYDTMLSLRTRPPRARGALWRYLKSLFA